MRFRPGGNCRKNQLLTHAPVFVNDAPCLASPKTNSSSPRSPEYAPRKSNLLSIQFMKQQMLIGALVGLAGSLLAADIRAKEELINAAKELGEKANYSWRTTGGVNTNVGVLTNVSFPPAE